MIEFILGVAVGAAFAPFWVSVWNTYIKPTVDKVFKKTE